MHRVMIEKLVEPRRILMAWQPPQMDSDRLRRVVGEVLPEAGGTLRYAWDTDDFEAARARGFQGHPAFPIDEDRSPRVGVLAPLLRRLPPRDRSDFVEYLALFALPAQVQDRSVLSDFGLLAYTEARLPSDGFGFVNPLDEMGGGLELVTEVSGYRRYRDPAGDPGLGEAACLVPEPENEKDANAVQVRVGGRCVGYINRVQAPRFRAWLAGEADVTATVYRVNGTSDRPRLHLFVRAGPPAAREGRA